MRTWTLLAGGAAALTLLAAALHLAGGAAGLTLLAAALHRPNAHSAEPAPQRESALADVSGARAPAQSVAPEASSPKAQHAGNAARFDAQQERLGVSDTGEGSAQLESSAGMRAEREHWRQLDDAFAAEREDRAWTAREDLAAKLEQGRKAGTVVRAVECRSTMCRAELAYADLHSYASAMLAQGGGVGLGGAPFWPFAQTQRVVSDPDSGELVTVAYYMREGHDLPVTEAAAPLAVQGHDYDYHLGHEPGHAEGR